MTDRAEVEIRSRADLRAWLAAHHEQAEAVRLLHFKKHTDHYVPYGEIVSELLCWGWIDGTTGKVDADRTAHLIAPRNPKSAWSAVNKRKVAEEREAGRMTAAGEAAITVAQRNGMWSFLDEIERLEVPDDLAAALGDVRGVWDDYPRSVKRGTLEWIKTAKTAPTRDKRIEDVRASAAEGLRPSPFRRR